MVTVFNTGFWLFFFMMGLVATIDCIDDFGAEVSMRLLRRVISPAIQVAVYVLAIILILKTLRLMGTTYTWTANALRIGSLLYVSTRMDDERVHAGMLMCVFITYYPYWQFNLVSMAGLVLALAVLQLMNHYRKWIRAHLQRLISVTVAASVLFWQVTRVAYGYDFATTLGVTAIFLAIMGTTNLYDRLMAYRRSRHRQLKRSNNHDELTDARSLALFKKDFHTYQNMMHAEHKNLHLAIIDIDHFKHINDTYGHLVGNEVLKRFVRDIDAYLVAMPYYTNVYRTGGEEFSVLMYDLTDSEAKAAMDAYAVRLRRLLVTKINPNLRITLSIGITKIAADDEPLSQFMERADNNLYGAKRSGRNHVVQAN
ncbi:GGDEF domain-containing protein [Lacticaseibacillus hulanensis]|uniref:GGDEF domain-containing protein n=1 Tax=Lacticaseibacillus hulanensis TaxID=2493111 RepID=UPI000FD75D89|nr:GGDEF domain-containing protein [Lacticaseibacillus hulanensis]